MRMLCSSPSHFTGPKVVDLPYAGNLELRLLSWGGRLSWLPVSQELQSVCYMPQIDWVPLGAKALAKQGLSQAVGMPSMRTCTTAHWPRERPEERTGMARLARCSAQQLANFQERLIGRCARGRMPPDALADGGAAAAAPRLWSVAAAAALSSAGILQGKGLRVRDEGASRGKGRPREASRTGAAAYLGGPSPALSGPLDSACSSITRGMAMDPDLRCLQQTQSRFTLAAQCRQHIFTLGIGYPT